MSKAVMISIRPKWCELIASGKKTIEVRKSKPKLETPFKCYIYCTRSKKHRNLREVDETFGGGMVIGEFVCDRILDILVSCSDPNMKGYPFPGTGLTDREIMDYFGNGKTGYGWHISKLVIYDKPQPLNWFVTEGDCDCMNCKKCSWFNRGNGYNVEDDCDLGYEAIRMKNSLKPLFRPPQSWCYVEELT